MTKSRSVISYYFVRDNLRSAICDSSVLASNLLGRILFHIRLLEGRILSRLSIFTDDISERKVEYLWILRNLKSGGVVLDVGCTGSLLCYELSARASEIFGIDSRPFKKRFTKLRFFLTDTCNTPFRDRVFDTIVVVSTIEHVGMGFYGDPTHNSNDALALRELARTMKKDGSILLTTPVVSKYAKYPGGRLYDLQTLSKLAAGAELIVEKKECYVPLKGKGWIQVKEDETRTERILTDPEKGHGVICLVLRKTEGTAASSEKFCQS